MQRSGLSVILWTSGLALALLPARASADVKLPLILSSHMVLQRDVPAPIWGDANPGEKITVKFRDQEKSTQADDKGRWMVKLDPLKAGGPDVLTVRGDNTLTLDDVLVGEVWLGSGQSNMTTHGSSRLVIDPVLGKLMAGSYPKIRLTGVGRKGWVEAGPRTSPGFSALLFSFGLRLHQELDVPVGLIVCAASGSSSGAWLTDAMLLADPACRPGTQKFLKTPEERKKKYEIDLAAWEKAVERAKTDQKKPPAKPAEPKDSFGGLYHGNLKSFVPFAIRGVLWDQGEAGTGISTLDQYTLMGALIRGWRQAWGLDLAFVYIQKPSGHGCAWDDDDPAAKYSDKFASLPDKVPPLSTGKYREDYIRIMKHPNTAMAISSDLCPGLHPVNRSGYGVRASKAALGLVYGKKVEYYGPIYQGHKIEGNKMRVTFTHVGQGLAHKHGDKLQGFAIAGADKKFVWADAVIDGDTVVLSSALVSEPVAVRYAWSLTHPWANLFNRDGLPALAFRTDTWEK